MKSWDIYEKLGHLAGQKLALHIHLYFRALVLWYNTYRLEDNNIL